MNRQYLTAAVVMALVAIAFAAPAIADPLPAGIGAEADAECSGTSAKGSGTATGPSPKATSSASALNQDLYEHEEEKTVVTAASVTTASLTGWNINDDFASEAAGYARISLPAVNGLDEASAKCKFSPQEILDLITRNLSFGCIANTMQANSANYVGELQRESISNTYYFVGQKIVGATAEDFVVPVVGGLMFTSSMTGTTLPPGVLFSTGLNIVSVFEAVEGLSSCETTVS